MLFAFSANALIVSNHSNSFDNLGSLVNKEKQFISCKNAHSSALADGDVVYFSLSADDGATCVVGGLGGVAGFGFGFPIAGVVNEGSCAVSAMCKVQVYGVHDAVKVDPVNGAPATAGQAAYASLQGKYLTGGGAIARTVEALAIAATYSQVGIFLDDVAATGTAQVFLKGL